jgi:hypothetical protein
MGEEGEYGGESEGELEDVPELEFEETDTGDME